MREGNAARSHEVAGIAGFAGALAGLAAALPVLTSLAAAALRSHAVPAAGLLAAAAFVPALGAALAATLLTFAQTGGVRVAPLKFDLGKLAPLPGLKRMFGAEAIVGAARALLAFAAVLAVVAPIGVRAVVAANANASPLAAAALARDGMLDACVAAAIVGAVFAFADYAFVRRRWLRSLRMTFDEFKRDAKENDGDPQAKSRRKQLHRTLLRSGVGNARNASFVVVNPTHIAIGIRYAPPQVAVPEIVVRAANASALQVRAIAAAAGIPVVEDVALARLLWQSGTAGRAIPPETFVAVAYTIAALVRAGTLAG
jgi:flagellar biosynthesis protein FlhB